MTATQISLTDLESHEVLAIIEVGQKRLKEIRHTESEKAAAKKRRDDAAWSNLWTKFQDDAQAVVPGGLCSFIDWRESQWRDDSRAADGSYCFFRNRGKEITIRCPGVAAVKIGFHWAEDESRWVCVGIHAPVWCPAEKTSARFSEQPDVYVAMAVARETFLAQAEYDATHPL